MRLPLRFESLYASKFKSELNLQEIVLRKEASKNVRIPFTMGSREAVNSFSFFHHVSGSGPHSLHQDVARDTTSETENRPIQDTTFASSVILDFTDGIKAAKIDHVTLGYHDFQYKLCFIQTAFRYIQCNVL